VKNVKVFMNKFLSFILGILFTSNTFSSEVLNYFNCSNDIDALSCNNSCEKKGFIRFIVTDKTATNLLMQLNRFNEGIKSTLLNNCKISDHRNWYCSELYADNKKLRSDGYKIFQMIDGKYSEQYNYYPNKTKQMPNDTDITWIKTFGCAK